MLGAVSRISLLFSADLMSMSEFGLVPRLVTSTRAAVISLNVMAPGSGNGGAGVGSGVLCIVIVTLPVPALMLVPAAMVISAAPASRLLRFALGSFAVRVRLPPPVVILAFNKILRPALSVMLPPAAIVGVVVIAAFTVMSLLACSSTAEP